MKVTILTKCIPHRIRDILYPIKLPLSTRSARSSDLVSERHAKRWKIDVGGRERSALLISVEKVISYNDDGGGTSPFVTHVFAKIKQILEAAHLARGRSNSFSISGQVSFYLSTIDIRIVFQKGDNYFKRSGRKSFALLHTNSTLQRTFSSALLSVPRFVRLIYSLP